MSKENSVFNKGELVNDAHIEKDAVLNEPALNEVKKGESLNEVYKIDTHNIKLFQDVNSSKPVLSLRQKYQQMIEGKKFEVSASGKKIYDSNSVVGFQITEEGLFVDRVKYSFDSVTLKINS